VSFTLSLTTHEHSNPRPLHAVVAILTVLYASLRVIEDLLIFLTQPNARTRLKFLKSTTINKHFNSLDGRQRNS